MPSINTDDIEITDDQQQADEDDSVRDEQEVLDSDETSAEVVEGSTAEESSDDEEDGVIVSIGEPAKEEEENRAPEWVRDMRKREREKTRRIKELEQQLVAASAQQEKAAPLGVKPTLESCDFDGERLAQELESWYERKSKVDAEAEKRRKAEEAEQAAWKARLDSYEKEKRSLKVSDFDDAESLVQDMFSLTQQGILVQAPRRAELIYALGKNPRVASQLASIDNPVDFAYKAAEIMAKLNVAPKKKAPPPEKKVSGNVAGASVGGDVLEKLRAEALKTGDISKVIAYKAQLRQKQAK